MKLKYFIIVLLILGVELPARGQGNLDSLSFDESLASILAADELLLDELDSLSIFDLLDSILTTDYSKSQLLAQLAFTSSVVNAGRDFGLNQQGLSPSLTYFHKSGFFAGVSGYWSSQLEPKYNVTVTSLGYFGIINSKLSYSFDYEHSFFHQSGVLENDPLVDEVAAIIDTETVTEFENPLSNNVGGGLLFDLKKVYTSIDYSFFFGQETAHRIEWRLAGNYKKKDFWIFDQLRINPSFAILLGNQKITASRFTDESNALSVEDLERRQRFELTAAVIEDLGETEFFRRLDNRGKLLYLQQRVLPIVEEALAQLEPQENAFGIMNYSFGLPVSVRKSKLGVTASYNYNLPVELPGEELDLSSSSYFGLSLTYYIGL